MIFRLPIFMVGSCLVVLSTGCPDNKSFGQVCGQRLRLFPEELASGEPLVVKVGDLDSFVVRDESDENTGHAGPVRIEEETGPFIASVGSEDIPRESLVTVACSEAGEGELIMGIMPDFPDLSSADCSFTVSILCEADDPPPGSLTDPANDCLGIDSSPSATCSGDVDIVTLEVDTTTEDLICIKVAFRDGTPVFDQGTNDARRGCSFLPAERNDSLGIACTWNSETMTWDESTEWLKSSTPDYVLESPPEGCRIEGDVWVFCVRPSKLPFTVGEFGCSASVETPENGYVRDKTGNLPIDG